MGLSQTRGSVTSVVGCGDIPIPSLVELYSCYAIEVVADTLDCFEWSWTVGKALSGWSAYMSFFEAIWKCKAPQNLKKIRGKVSRNRCWTVDSRLCHSLATFDTCFVCLQESETICW